MDHSADYWIQNLNLLPHPEGGYYREVYRSSEHIPHNALPERYSGDRNFATSIYFLLESGLPSRLHRLKSDELWFFHDGSPLEVVMIDGAGSMTRHRLGTHLEKGEVPQVVMPGGAYFGARVCAEKSFTLVSCVVAPGFDFRDFEMPGKEGLVGLFPAHRDIILEF